jgi:hypothetical protein
VKCCAADCRGEHPGGAGCMLTLVVLLMWVYLVARNDEFVNWWIARIFK